MQSMQNQAMIQEIMQAFTVRTGLVSDAVNSKRYPWTDAFAVCIFLRLYQALNLVDQVPDEPLVKNLERYQALADEIIRFWLLKENQQNSTWQEHIDINSVMLATALAPEGYQELHKGEDHGK